MDIERERVANKDDVLFPSDGHGVANLYLSLSRADSEEGISSLKSPPQKELQGTPSKDDEVIFCLVAQNFQGERKLAETSVYEAPDLLCMNMVYTYP